MSWKGLNEVPAETESIWLATLNAAERSELREVAASTVHSLPDPDLLVLGGDLVGLAVAYFAAERGARVLVLLEDAVPGADAEASLGCVIPNACSWQFSEATQPVAQASRDWWAKLAVRPEFQLDWRVSGALMVDAERLVPNARLRMLAGLEAGYSLHDVDAEQIALLEPALAPCPAGGLHYPSEAVIHPLKAVLGFVRGLRNRGGQIACGTAESPVVSSNKVTSVPSTAGVIQPKAIFAGSRSNQKWVDGGQGNSPTKYEVTQRTFLATSPQTALLKRPVLDANWIVQLKSGEVVTEVSGGQPGDIAAAVARVRQLIPALAEVEFSRCWSGTSECSADRVPVVDQASDQSNIWYCRGLDFGATLFAPIIGKSVADWIMTGQSPEELAPLTSGTR